MEISYLHIILNMLLVIGLIIVCMFTLKKIRAVKYANNKSIRVVNVVPIGTKEKIILVEVNNTTLVLGATPNHIETLYVFNENQHETKQVAVETSASDMFEKQMETVANR